LAETAAEICRSETLLLIKLTYDCCANYQIDFIMFNVPLEHITDVPIKI